MRRTMLIRINVIACVLLLLQPQPPPPAQTTTRAFTGMTLIDGLGGAPMPNAVMVVSGGRILAAGPASKTRVAPGVERVDLSGRFVVPGLVNAHGHVGATMGLENRPEGYTEDNLRRQLGLYARYGVTTVVSLGDDGEAGFRLRDENSHANLTRSRLYVAGPVIAAKTPEHARAAVDAAAKLKPDWIKIRVDDNLGTTEKMPPEVYRAVIARAHEHKLRVAAHLFYLADAKELVRAGADYLAHSVRDAPVDKELIDLMKARNVCLCPTLMREVSTFVYESRPAFFDDPFFRREADPKVLAALEDPARMAGVAKSTAAQRYKKALEIARQNAKVLHDSGVRLAAGTDTGPPARFQGYFEHLELEEMVKSSLSPSQVLVSATSDAARCVGLDTLVGALRPSRYADFIVLSGNPLDDIRNTRTLESVWIAGNKVGGTP
jgi:imidazolonepropionase-like amidohydrolase